MVFRNLIKHYPYFVKASEHLESSSFFFEKTLRKIKALRPDYKWAEKICKDAFELCERDQKTYLKNVYKLVDFSVEFLRLQALLEKTGKYYCANFKEVEKRVYNDPKRSLNGAPYMWALYFSQVFWETHHRVFQFFLSDFARTKQKRGRALEVPLGTGVFTTHFLLQNPLWKGVGIDLGDTSIDFSKALMRINKIGSNRVTILKEDLYKYQCASGYDRIMCGEFLEHVEDPIRVLKKLHDFLSPKGKVFVTVAVWASMIDHIYLYKSAEEVRQHIRAAGFRIETELVQNVFEKGKPDQEKTPINYCAILSK